MEENNKDSSGVGRKLRECTLWYPWLSSPATEFWSADTKSGGEILFRSCFLVLRAIRVAFAWMRGGRRRFIEGSMCRDRRIGYSYCRMLRSAERNEVVVPSSLHWIHSRGCNSVANVPRRAIFPELMLQKSCSWWISFVF